MSKIFAVPGLWKLVDLIVPQYWHVRAYFFKGRNHNQGVMTKGKVALTAQMQ